MGLDVTTLYEKLRTTYWFIPGVLIVSSILLSFVTVAIDEAYTVSLEGILGWMDIIDPDGARNFLSIVSGSMIGVTGVTFSITIVALVQASSQFGPRLLNTFLRDRGNQVVLGTFMAAYTYCLLLMRSVTSTSERVFVPSFSLFVAAILAIFSVGVLVYFFHHVTVILQAEHVIASLGRDLDETISRLFPETSDYSTYGHGLESNDDIPAEMDEREKGAVSSEKAGYLQAIDIDALVSMAHKEDLFLRSLHKPGDFVQKDGELVEVWPHTFNEEVVVKTTQAAFILGDQRLRINDVEFLVNQLVEIAVRALSPGINDPFTAMACIDQLGSVLSGLMKKTIPQGYHYDSDDTLRLLTDALSFSGIIEASFNQIRQNAYSDVAVTIRLLDAILAMAPHVQTSEQRATLFRQAKMLSRCSKEAVPEEWDREEIQKRFDSVSEELKN